MINGTPEPFAVFFDYYGACQSFHYGITNFLGCLNKPLSFAVTFALHLETK